MSFREPHLLWLLWLLIIPIMLYLLPIPHRRSATSALFLWDRFLRSERFGRTSERFRRALGFACIIAVLVCLCLAAADLTVGTSSIKARRLIVLVDASASMNAVVDDESNLSRARAAAARLIGSLDADTKVAVMEATGELDVLLPFGPSRREAIRTVMKIEPFDGPGDLSRALEEAHRLWGTADDVEVYAFTDRRPDETAWGERLRAWIAPKAGDNPAIVRLSARRVGREVVARFALANYGRSPRTLAGSILANGLERDFFKGVTLDPGQVVERTTRFEEVNATALQIKLDVGDGEDAIEVDDEARMIVPSLDDMRVRVLWPEKGGHNVYVRSVLSSLREQGSGEPSSQAAEDGPGRVAVYVNRQPTAWPQGGAIVLCPFKSGLLQIDGVLEKPVVVTRQAAHPLMEGVALRGLSVKKIVRARVPGWARPLAWAGDQPLMWAGECPSGNPETPSGSRDGKCKVLFIGVPPALFASRLPLTPSFPALMRNALLWMLPPTEAMRPGDYRNGWTSRTTGFIENGTDGKVCAFSLLDGRESDLRREDAEGEDPPSGRRSLAAFLIAAAILLMGLEWALFHKRITE